MQNVINKASTHTFCLKVSEVAQSFPTLCDPIDCSLPGSSVHGIFQARILEWVAISFSRRSSWLRHWTWVSSIVGRLFTIWATREVLSRHTISSGGVSDGKESTCNVRDLGSIPGLGRSLGGGHGNPLQYSCLGNSHGQRRLEGYSPWGRKEVDTIEQLGTQHRGSLFLLTPACCHSVQHYLYTHTHTKVYVPYMPW